MFRKASLFPILAAVLFVALPLTGCANKNLKCRVQSLQKQADQCEQRLTALQDTTMILRAAMDSTQGNLQAGMASRDSLQNRIDELENSLQSSASQEQNLRAQLDQERERVAAAQRQSATRAQPATRQRAVAPAMSSAMRSELEQARAMINSQNAEIDSLHGVENQLQSQISDNEETIAQLRAGIDTTRVTPGTTASRDNRVRTLSALLVLASAAFVVSLVWAIVKK